MTKIIQKKIEQTTRVIRAADEVVKDLQILGNRIFILLAQKMISQTALFLVIALEKESLTQRNLLWKKRQS